MTATLFFRDGRREVVSGMMGEIIDIATKGGAYRVQTEGGGVLRWFGGEWIWFK